MKPRRAPEDLSQQRHETLQAGLDLIDRGFTVFDADLRLVAWNRAFLSLLDFPSELAFVGAPFEGFMRYNAERGDYGPGDTERQVTERVSAARSFVPHDIERVRPNGQVLRVVGRPMPGHGFVTLYSDITEQRRAEETIRRHNIELEQRVAERSEELRRTQALMLQVQKMEAIGQLTGGLAHDFNNLLTVIVGNLATLAERRRADADAMELVEPALLAARRGGELIRGLLSFARREPLKVEVVDAAKSLASVTQLVHRSLPETLRIDVEAVPASLWTSVDPRELETALLNLLLNARDATAGDGRVIVRATTCRLDAPEAGAKQLAPGAYHRIDVIDDGCGMDEATLARVFEPFFTTKPVGAGSGLGLAVVYGFVRRSGGAIQLVSRLDEGTEVSIWLPVALPPDARESSVAPPPPTVKMSRGLALLVEDDAGVRHVARRSLLDLGYVVLEAENGAEAREILSRTRGITLVLTDVVMPGGVDGRDLARDARDVHGVPRVLLMSGHAPARAFADDLPLLAKPFSPRELADALEAM